MADSDIHPAVAEPVDAGDCPRQLQRVMQRGDQHRDPQPQPGGARGGVGEHLQRRDLRRAADNLFHRPAALEAELLGADEIVLHAHIVEPVVVQLGD